MMETALLNRVGCMQQQRDAEAEDQFAGHGQTGVEQRDRHGVPERGIAQEEM